MRYSHNEKSPTIDPSAYVAPTAVISGDVTIGAKCAVLHGAIITAEGAPVVIGSECVVMEHAVIRASGGAALTFATTIGQRCIVGPHAYIVGATLGDGCYIASGGRVCNDAHVSAQTTVPMHHIAYGNPAVVVGPEKAHAVLEATALLETVFNETSAPDAASKAAATYA
ncbi:MAG: gamma carbonic anhydrase family protein, partial [Vulcanimicrobiaceae bacterium]